MGNSVQLFSPQDESIALHVKFGVAVPAVSPTLDTAGIEFEIYKFKNALFTFIRCTDVQVYLLK